MHRYLEIDLQKKLSKLETLCQKFCACGLFTGVPTYLKPCKIVQMALMDLIQALSPVERRAFYQLLDVGTNNSNTETLRTFAYRMSREKKIPTRLFNIIISGGQWVEEHFPNKKLLDIPISQITYKDVHFLKGMGEKSWAQFVALREANR